MNGPHAGRARRARRRADLQLAAASLVGMASAIVAPRLGAEGSTIGIRYSAPSSCPTELEFLGEVRQRNRRVEGASPLDSAQLVVTINEGAAPRYSGRLERVTSRGKAGVREITGESCRDVAKALALITVLTADLVSRPLPDEPAKVSAPIPEPRFDVPTSPAVGADDLEAPPRPTPADARGVPRGRWQIGLEGLLASGVTPNPLAGFTIFGEVDARSSALWAPGVRLSASLGLSSWSASDSSEAHFAWMVASLDGCLFQLGDPLDLSVRSCARVTGGFLRSAGSGRVDNHVRYPTWIDAGVVLRAHWQVGRALFFDAEAEAFMPQLHYALDFTFPSNTTDVAGTFGVRFGAGLGVLFR